MPTVSSIFCTRCGSSTPFAGLPDERRRVQSARCPPCTTAVRRGEDKWITRNGETRHCASCGIGFPARSKYARCQPCRTQDQTTLPALFIPSCLPPLPPSASIPTFNCQYPSTYSYRDASANVNTRSLFAIPAHCPIPKFKTTGDAYDTRVSDIPLSPDWNTRNTSAAPYATLLQLMWRSPSAVPSKVPVLWSL